MPELPEVETIARGLQRLLVGRIVCAVSVTWPRTIGCPDSQRFIAGLVGRRVWSVGRRGKYLVLVLDTGYLLVHLKMSGRLRVIPAAQPLGPHTRVALDLDDGQQLRFDDARKFGRIYLVEDLSEVTGALGPEPLDDSLTLEAFARLLQKRSGRLKPLLLNQKFLAGVGNIYADEALFRAGLNPLTPATSLAPDEQARLYEAIRHVLREAVAHGGTTLDDHGYVDAEGQVGRFQLQVAVYQQQGKPCRRCGTPIERIVIGQRSAHYCPTCQPFGQREGT
jgi:formamidopyrimidine-DNA glycosylase